MPLVGRVGIDEQLAQVAREALQVGLDAGADAAEPVVGQAKRQAVHSANAALGEGAAVPANLRRLTNIGTFRAYVQAYLQAHPGVHQGMTLMVRMLEPTAEGVPLELYCFTATTAWVQYEAIQGDIFDHLLALLPEFDLRLYQSPTGWDIRSGLQQKGLP